MSDASPNPQQEDLIESGEGIYAVDAGAGTGKTYSITRRYARLLERSDVEPADILLVTFTNNAAAEMKERIVEHCEYSMAALRDAPIQTFHSFCHELLTRDGFAAPELLGVDDRITRETRVIENEVVETRYFREFIDEFLSAHPEYHDFARVLHDRTSVLDVIKELAAKGVFPTATGWFRHGEGHLDGDLEAFKAQLRAENRPNEGAYGPTQSDLRGNLSGWGRETCYVPAAPSEAALRDAGPDNQAVESLIVSAFEEERSELKAFVHDVYFAYIEFALGRNYLNFGFLQMFAFTLLCEDERVRSETAFEFVMVDEFQDTSEIQFKLALLLARTDNLCVVGDWKQSIFGFQYAAVENILEFESRLEQFKADLNTDTTRVPYAVEDVEWIRLRQNYRSTQSILDFSEHSLTLEAVNRESLDASAIREEITRLESNTTHDHSRIEALSSADECEAILDRIQTIVGNRAYGIETDAGGLRTPRLDDIAVLTRTRRFGREFQQTAAEYNVPVAYEGGVELFGMDQALLVLAWLRILAHGHSDRGWAVVLERAGYRLDEVQHILGQAELAAYPAEMVAFREELASIETIGGITRRVLDQYGFNDAYADALITTLEGTFEQSTYNLGDVIQFMEASLAADSTVEVDDSPGTEAVTVQTIHAAKGLEHPIVIMANINQNTFPPAGGGADRIRFADPIGLRQTKVYADPDGVPYAYDNWRYDAVAACFPREYDEERRLMYVAMTRAKDHLLFSAGASPSSFFEALPVEPEVVEPEVERDTSVRTTQAQLQIAVPAAVQRPSWSPHSLMDEAVFGEVTGGRGPEFGEQVHDFAEAIVAGDDPVPQNQDEERVLAFLRGVEGRLRSEVPAYLPLSVDGERVTISGVVDLVAVADGVVRIVDFKTDTGRQALSEYEKQVSVYYHVVAAQYPDRDVKASIFFTYDGEEVVVEPLSTEDLAALVRDEQLAME